MQKPTAPIFVVDDWPSRWVAAPRRSCSACEMLIAMKSLPAPSGSLAVLPWYMSGASAVNPSAANRSHTLLMWPTSPHHSWSTSTPDPLPAAGVARYPAVLLPFDANSIMLPAMDKSPYELLVPGTGRLMAETRAIFTDMTRRASDSRTVIE